MMVLAFDTSAAHCAAALLWGKRVIASRHEAMEKGQAERLMPLLEEVLAEGGAQWALLDALAVGTGPGNFTGVRIAVAAARGLALGLGVPAVGVSTFEIMRGRNSPLDKRPQLVSLPAPRGQVHVQRFRNGATDGAPRLCDLPFLPGDLFLPDEQIDVIGHEAGVIAYCMGQRRESEEPRGFDAALFEYAETIARIAATKLALGLAAGHRPAPVYVRPADALPPSDPPPVILP